MASGGAIVLALHAGTPHIGEQIDSFLAQTVRDWILVVSNDGPDDGALAKIESARQGFQNGLIVTSRKSYGFADNFLSALADVPEEVEWVALSDQDDVWLPQKLSRAVEALRRTPHDQPALYAASRLLWDPRTNKTWPTQISTSRGPSFANALVENVAPGNTIVFNRAALNILKPLAKDARRVFAHDWWIYQILTGVGSAVTIDAEPVVLYRQHGGNLIGETQSIVALIRRKWRALMGDFSRNMSLQLAALEPARHILTPENQRILEAFVSARAQKNPLLRLYRLMKSGAHRQSAAAHLSLLIAALLGKI
nr:glycosyltransferase [uncultured Celeribacter sp.]